MTSIRRHLTAGLLGGFALLLGAGGGAIYYATRAGLYREFDNALRLKAQAMAALTKRSPEGVKFEFPKKLQPVTGATAGREIYQVFAIHGPSLERAVLLDDTDLPRRFGSLAVPLFFNLDLPGDVPGRAVGIEFTVVQEPKEKKPPKPEPEPPPSKPVKPAKPPPPLLPPLPVGLVVAADRTQLDSTLSTLGTLLLVAGTTTLLATIGLVAGVLGRGLKPLQELARHAGQINATSLQTPVPVAHLPVELAPIAHRLNDSLDRLHSSFERERRFSADIAHELRTPIAELRSLAEVKLRCAAATDQAGFREALDIALQMENLVTQLLALSRAERQAVAARQEPISVGGLVDSLWQALAARAQAKQLRVQFAIPPQTQLTTDPDLLRGLLQNLLANAVIYTPAGGVVRIAADIEPNRFSFTVTNTVTGLTPADLPRMFDRFWRKDLARSDARHSGLGLALARSFAGLLGLQLTAHLNGENQLTLALSAVASLERRGPASLG